MPSGSDVQWRSKGNNIHANRGHVRGSQQIDQSWWSWALDVEASVENILSTVVVATIITDRLVVRRVNSKHVVASIASAIVGRVRALISSGLIEITPLIVKGVISIKLAQNEMRFGWYEMDGLS